jgi:hypothetical protein
MVVVVVVVVVVQSGGVVCFHNENLHQSIRCIVFLVAMQKDGSMKKHTRHKRNCEMSNNFFLRFFNFIRTLSKRGVILVVRLKVGFGDLMAGHQSGEPLPGMTVLTLVTQTQRNLPTVWITSHEKDSWFHSDLTSYLPL